MTKHDVCFKFLLSKSQIQVLPSRKVSSKDAIFKACVFALDQALFLTPAAKKLKLKHETQAKNSRKKLNQREALSSFWEKVQKKTHFYQFIF